MILDNIWHIFFLDYIGSNNAAERTKKMSAKCYGVVCMV
jgi:hypothetical protein